jgi:hypothetical protein
LTDAQHREIQELLGAYALDAVDKDVAEVIDQHLEECVKCSVEVAQHHEVAGLLANSGGASPAGLWDGIAARLNGASPPSWERLASRLGTAPDAHATAEDADVGAAVAHGSDTGGTAEDADVGAAVAHGSDTGGTADGPTPAQVVPIDRARRRNRMLVRGASIVAAAAAVVAVVLGVQVHHLHGQVSALQSNRLSAVERSALADPSTKTIELAAGSAADAPSRKVTVVLTKSGTGFVEAGALDALPSDQTYQLWAVIGDQTISLGLLGSQPSVVPFSVAGNADVSAFAITAERAGGVVHSTHQPVVAGEVTV